MSWPGFADLDRAAEALAARLPPPLRPLARIAYDYGWSWTPGGPELFRDVDRHRWRVVGENPVRLLRAAPAATLEAAAARPELIARAQVLADALAERRARHHAARPVAFFCAELGVHASLPTYSGGLGVLAGDILKEASDRGVAMVGVSILYRQGYFRQRIDLTGWQHEYWLDMDPSGLPLTRVTGADGAPISVSVPLFGRAVLLHVWCGAVGGVPMYLLDAEREENTTVDRWITARLYEGNRVIRLAQYATLGLGGVRALGAMGIDPEVVHLNEGHAVLAALELAAERVAAGDKFAAACDHVRQRVVFTTHTPVPAGNESYSAKELGAIIGELPPRLGIGLEELVALSRQRPSDAAEPAALTAMALRLSRHANGVSQRHAEVARKLWTGLFPGRPVDQVPIVAVTNGVHLPTWMGGAMQALLDRHLAPGWRDRADDPATWQAVATIPDEELWAVRVASRAALIAAVRTRSELDRLRRGEPLDYVEAAATSLSPEWLTIGFARRLATYKRLHLLTLDARRALALLTRAQPLQLLFAGKAHPQDDSGKRTLQHLFELKHGPDVAQRVAFLEDYDMDSAQLLVSGCDVWLNLPRPPNEASGTSGMKAMLNGALHLSVLDGWWAEAYDGANGWAIASAPLPDEHAEDERDAAAFYQLLETEVLPQFYQRDAAGVPRRWVQRIKASLLSLGPRFNASRMLREYQRRAYPGPPG